MSRCRWKRNRGAWKYGWETGCYFCHIEDVEQYAYCPFCGGLIQRNASIFDESREREVKDREKRYETVLLKGDETSHGGDNVDFVVPTATTAKSTKEPIPIAIARRNAEAQLRGPRKILRRGDIGKDWDQMKDYVVFDFETGGRVAPHHKSLPYHPPIQLGLLAIKDGAEVDSLDLRLRFDPEKCEPGVLGIKNSWSEEGWAGAIGVPIARKRVEAFFERHGEPRRSKNTGNEYRVAQLVGYNSTQFDLKYLRWMFFRDGFHASLDDVGFISATHWIGTGGCRDVMFLAQAYEDVTGYEFANLRQETVYQELFDREHKGAHDALEDCRATHEIYQELLRRLRVDTLQL